MPLVKLNVATPPEGPEPTWIPPVCESKPVWGPCANFGRVKVNLQSSPSLRMAPPEA